MEWNGMESKIENEIWPFDDVWCVKDAMYATYHSVQISVGGGQGNKSPPVSVPQAKVAQIVVTVVKPLPLHAIHGTAPCQRPPQRTHGVHCTRVVGVEPFMMRINMRVQGVHPKHPPH